MNGWLGLDEEDKCAIFIDGANLYKTARNLGFDIDYKTLLKKTNEEARLIRAYYYTAMQEDRDQDYSPLRPLVDWLDYNGYSMVTKIAREFTDSQGKKRYKGSIDIELVVDLMLLADKIDSAVIFTGNGDFRRAIEAVQAKGVKVTLVSTVKTSPPMAGDDLRRQADHFIDLVELQNVIGRKGAPPRKDVEFEDEYEDDFDD